MRKTTTYARKIRRQNAVFNGAEWLNTLTKCRPYTDELLPGAIAKEGSFETIRRSIIRVRLAFESIKNGNGTETDFDMLAHATGVAKIRFAQIAGNENDAVEVLNIADGALERARYRYQRTNSWGFDGPALSQILEALDLYEAIATSSSPAQMHDAMMERDRIIKEQRRSMQ